MVHATQNNAQLAFEAQIRESFGRVVYTAKTHEKNADICTNKLNWIKNIQIVLSAFITVGAITALLGDPKVNHLSLIITVMISAIQLALSSYMKEVDPGQQTEKHKKTASDLWDIRESYLSILTDLRDPNFDFSSMRNRRDELQIRLARIYETAPRTNSKAYGLASNGLKNNEELTFSDDEIDRFLPAALRLSQPN